MQTQTAVTRNTEQLKSNYPFKETIVIGLLSEIIMLGETQPGNNVHGLKLLEEQFAGVGDLDGRHVLRRTTILTPARISDQTALVTNVHL